MLILGQHLRDAHEIDNDKSKLRQQNFKLPLLMEVLNQPSRIQVAISSASMRSRSHDHCSQFNSLMYQEQLGH